MASKEQAQGSLNTVPLGEKVGGWMRLWRGTCKSSLDFHISYFFFCSFPLFVLLLRDSCLLWLHSLFLLWFFISRLVSSSSLSGIICLREQFYNYLLILCIIGILIPHWNLTIKNCDKVEKFKKFNTILVKSLKMRRRFDVFIKSKISKMRASINVKEFLRDTNKVISSDFSLSLHIFNLFVSLRPGLNVAFYMGRIKY